MKPFLKIFTIFLIMGIFGCKEPGVQLEDAAEAIVILTNSATVAEAGSSSSAVYTTAIGSNDNTTIHSYTFVNYSTSDNSYIISGSYTNTESISENITTSIYDGNIQLLGGEYKLLELDYKTVDSTNETTVSGFIFLNNREFSGESVYNKVIELLES